MYVEKWSPFSLFALYASDNLVRILLQLGTFHAHYTSTRTKNTYFCWCYMKYTRQLLSILLQASVKFERLMIWLHRWIYTFWIEPICLGNFNTTKEIKKWKTYYWETFFISKLNFWGCLAGQLGMFFLVVRRWKLLAWGHRVMLEHSLEIPTGWRQTSWLFTRLAENWEDELGTIENTMAAASWSEQDLNLWFLDCESGALATLSRAIIKTCEIQLLHNVIHNRRCSQNNPTTCWWIQYRSELSEPKTHVLNEPLTH